MQPSSPLPIRATVKRSAVALLREGDRIEIRSAFGGVELLRTRDGLGKSLFSAGGRTEAVVGEVEDNGQRLTLLAVRSRKNPHKILGFLIDEDDGRITTGEWTADEDGTGGGEAADRPEKK